MTFIVNFSAALMDARAGIYANRLRAQDVIHGEAYTEQAWVLRGA